MELFEPFRNEPYSDFTQEGPQQAYRRALAQVRGQLGRDYPLLVGNEPLETGHWIVSYNPCAKDEVIGRAAKAQPAQIEPVMAAAWRGYAEWSGWSMAERARTLVKLAAIMRQRKLELAAWMTLEAGKNYAEAEADTAEAIDFVEYYARESLRLAEPLPTYPYPGEENTSFLIPIGVGVVIPPWNFPLAILTGMTIGPVAVGNAVIVKPASDTPVIAAKFMECVLEAGFPPGVINYFPGGGSDIGDALVDHPRTRFINFTGSLAVGLRINERAAKVQTGQTWLKKAYMELGGKDALIIDESADLDLAAAAAAVSGYGFQGQKCSAMSRLIAVEEIYDALLEKFLARVGALILGPAEENYPVNAVISAKAQESILGYIAKGKEQARLVLGGKPASAEGHYLEPTVFADVPEDAAIACEEIFGPVVAIMRAKDFSDALRIANDSPYGLTGGVISRRRRHIERARREFMAGNLYINRKITGALVGVQPFGGFKLSGSNAKAGGPDYLRLFMEMKTVTERF
jgi:1-pyrroline-5-carboxylate dehydrogenase